MPKIDTIRDSVKVIEIKGLKGILQYTVKTAIENKVYSNGTIDGYTVSAIYGTKFFGNNKKSCPEGLTNQQHHYHSGAVMSIIGSGPKLTVGFEMARPREDSATKNEGSSYHQEMPP